ncbi:MAG TPA: D-alanyl-D-alanine carboxypeptidase/D-alanyl-D-alanine-endopeptidase, partial [Gammaproteobacteria bacterium]|nr:D-alanyl-D-alanine carboxypeptidase/D-alanyl-D-alanine-endopeptidase [Gammaproteobacteria bacterium]
MRFWRYMIGLLLVCGLSSALPARSKISTQPIYGKDKLIAEINRILTSVDSNASVGIAVKSMRYGDTLYAKNINQLFVPASILKIFTAEAALLYLGPTFTFPTRFFTDAADSNTSRGVLNGNIYLVHSGDPSLTYSDITTLMTTLKSQQIHSVNGNVYIDNTAYDQAGIGPGWDGDDTRYCYGAPINASIINHN